MRALAAACSGLARALFGRLNREVIFCSLMKLRLRFEFSICGEGVDKFDLLKMFRFVPARVVYC